MLKYSGYISTSKPILIGGCGRSGTTLMRVMLDSHPDICCGPESDLFNGELLDLSKVTTDYWGKLAWKFDFDTDSILKLASACGSHAEFVDRFFLDYTVAKGRKIWADKTPRNILMLDYIFEVFPKAKFIHMIRDGRDVVCSLRHHPRHKVVDGVLVPTGIINPIEKCLERWVHDVSSGLRHRQDARYIEIHYEDLVLNPEATTQRLFSFLEVEWNRSVLDFHEVNTASRDITKFPQNPEATESLKSSAIGRWAKDLTPSELSFVEQNDNGLLSLLGYRN